MRVNCLTEVASYLLYIHMTTATAKVFKSGNSQAVRLPKAFRLTSKIVKLVKTTDGFTVSDPTAHARRLKAFVALAGSCPDFHEIPANASPNFRREWE
jgi:antitoxin VapB